MKFLTANIKEIIADKALSAYGIFLALSYILTIYYWYSIGGLGFAVTEDAWCWPFYPGCWQYRMTLSQSIGFFALIAGCAAVCLSCFVYKKIKAGYWMLVCAWLLMTVLVIQDFRFRTNQFYMLSWVTLVYLFIPHKRVSLAAIIIAFYFWAGSLKLNWEWISGSALYNKLWTVPEQFTVAACIYVIFLEMVFIWGLLSRKQWIFWIVLAQLAVFHFESLSQIAYFYPALMFLILSFFCLERWYPGSSGRYPSLAVWHWPIATWSIFAAFAVCQVIPLMTSLPHLRVDSKRFLALHMLEAKYICTVTIKKSNAGSAEETFRVDIPLPYRMRCDPIVYWNHARNRCRQWQQDTTFQSADAVMTYRKSSEEKVVTLPLYACRAQLD